MSFSEHLRFTSKIIPSESTFKARSTKIELKMKPADTNDRWLDGYVYSNTVDVVPGPILSNQPVKNWDQIATSCLTDDEEDEMVNDQMQSNGMFQSMIDMNSLTNEMAFQDMSNNNEQRKVGTNSCC